MAGNPPVAGIPPNMRTDTLGMVGPNPKEMLPTFIYDYLIKEREYGLAQAMLSSNLHIHTLPKSSPKDANGVDDDSKDEHQKRLESLPRPRVQEQLPDTPFLKEWWALFWDLWSASRGKSTPPTALQYFQASQSTARQQSQARQSMMQQGMMTNANMNLMNNMRMQAGGNMRNGGMDMRQTAIANSRPGMVRPQMNLQQQPGQGQMQREGSDMDLNGQRPQSPMSGGDNEPSPKRPRTDGGPQMPGRPGMHMPNGVPVSAAMMQAGFDASMMNGGQFPGGPNGKQMPVFGMGKPGMPGQPPQGSPMMGPNGEMPGAGDMAAFQAGMQRNAMQGGNQQGGALADYQMQLMLLEQQNKKRLLMARQEHDVMSHAGGAPGTGQGAGPGAPGGTLMGAGPGGLMTAPGMSPHGSRTGHSPNNDQMKRGTPKMGQTSPLPDGSMPSRGSPVPGFDASMAHNMVGHPMFMGNKMGEAQMGPGGNMMRPPNGMPGGFIGPNGTAMTPQQMEMMTRNGGRIPSGGWPGGPQMPGGQIMPGGPQQPPLQVPGDNGQRGQMPPPSAPAGNNGRTQPSSPQAAAPPTPSQASKPAPKKKDTKDSKKKGGQKKAAATTGANPSSEPARPPTPTPPTPTTPVHPNSFIGSKAQSGSANAQPQAAAGQQPPAASAPSADATATAGPFGNIDPTNDMGMGAFDFQNTDNSDVLDGFDFDSFLHMDDSMPFNDFDPSQFPMGGDGVEMGTADP